MEVVMGVVFLTVVTCLLFIAVLLLGHAVGVRTGKTIAKHDIEEQRRRGEEQDKLAFQRRKQRNKPKLMPRPARALKLVASGGKRVYHENVVTADFRNKPKKGPDDSGPKGAA